MKIKVLKIEPVDNVVVALEPGEAGSEFEIDGTVFSLRNSTPAGHKIALEQIETGENVVKYGYPIGHATQQILPGDHIHTHNVKTNLSGVLDYEYRPELANPEVAVDFPRASFQGFRRANGQVGIRQDLLIVPTVGCINNTAQRVKDEFLKNNPGALEVFSNVIVLKHPYGCSQLGADHANTRDFLANAVLHPNAAGVLVLGLGCENNTIEVFKETLEASAKLISRAQKSPDNCASGLSASPASAESSIDSSRIKFLIAQQVEDEVAAGAALCAEILEVAKGDSREEVPVSELRVGLKCGGSDGFSGISANPLLGKLSDFVVQRGGTALLTEVPEMFGAETILMNRAVDKNVFDKIVSLINNFKQFFLDSGEPVYENPSPGNKAGGITTLEDKSLGCTQKAGTAKVSDVIDYAQVVATPGLNLLQSPGNDLVAASALAVAGCHLVLFTTGRGNPYGTFVPTLKVSSNPWLSAKKPGWIDFDAGRLLSEDFAAVVPDFIDLVLRTASGEKARNELGGYSEVAIFKTGITL